MKKQIFLLSLLFAAFNMPDISAQSNCCESSCNNSCGNSCDSSCGNSCDNSCNNYCNSCDNSCNSCDNICVPEHGHTYMYVSPAWQGATPERVSLFESHRLKNLKDDKKGAFQLALFGGGNTKAHRAAAFFFTIRSFNINI